MLDIREGVSRIFWSKIFCPTEPNNFKKEPFLVLKKFWFREISRIWVGDGLSRFSVKNFLSLRTDEVRRGTLLCFRNFLTSRIVRDERVGITIFRRNCFVSQYRINSKRNSSWFWESLVSKNFMDMSGGWIITIFRQSFFLSHRPEGLRRGAVLCFRRILVSRNVRDKGPGIGISHRKFVVSHYRKTS